MSDVEPPASKRQRAELCHKLSPLELQPSTILQQVMLWLPMFEVVLCSGVSKTIWKVLREHEPLNPGDWRRWNEVLIISGAAASREMRDWFRILSRRVLRVEIRASAAAPMRAIAALQHVRSLSIPSKYLSCASLFDDLETLKVIKGFVGHSETHAVASVEQVLTSVHSLGVLDLSSGSLDRSAFVSFRMWESALSHLRVLHLWADLAETDMDFKNMSSLEVFSLKFGRAPRWQWFDILKALQPRASTLKTLRLEYKNPDPQEPTPLIESKESHRLAQLLRPLAALQELFLDGGGIAVAWEPRDVAQIMTDHLHLRHLSLGFCYELELHLCRQDLLTATSSVGQQLESIHFNFHDDPFEMGDIATLSPQVVADWIGEHPKIGNVPWSDKLRLQVGPTDAKYMARIPTEFVHLWDLYFFCDEDASHDLAQLRELGASFRGPPKTSIQQLEIRHPVILEGIKFGTATKWCLNLDHCPLTDAWLAAAWRAPDCYIHLELDGYDLLDAATVTPAAFRNGSGSCVMDLKDADFSHWTVDDILATADETLGGTAVLLLNVLIEVATAASLARPDRVRMVSDYPDGRYIIRLGEMLGDGGV